MDLARLEQEIARLDLALRPIAERPVDIAQPGWADQRVSASPLDEAGIRSQAQSALESLVSLYAQGDDRQRAGLRQCLSTCKAFRWAASLDCSPSTAEGFRLHLLHWSACDQGSDVRDEILRLDYLCQAAAGNGVDIAPILSEVAPLSSAVDKYGMGSTRSFLLRWLVRISGAQGAPDRQ